MKTHTLIKQIFCLTVLLGFIAAPAYAQGKMKGISEGLSKITKGELNQAVSQTVRETQLMTQGAKTAKFMSSYATPTVIDAVHSVKQNIKKAQKFVQELEQMKADFSSQHQAILKAVSEEAEMDQLGNTFIKKIKSLQDPKAIKESLTNYFHLNESNPTVGFLLDHPHRLDRIPGIEAERRALSLRNENTEQAIKNLKEITMKMETEKRLGLMRQLREELESFIQERGHCPGQTQDPWERNLYIRTVWFLQDTEAAAGIPELEIEHQAILDLWNK